jgi:hypothetical protein
VARLCAFNRNALAMLDWAGFACARHFTIDRSSVPARAGPHPRRSDQQRP